MTVRSARLGRWFNVLAGSTVLLLAVGCSAAPASVSPKSAAESTGMTTSSEPLPIPRSVARQLPVGVFYILAGPDPASYNLWQVSNTGSEVQLTRNQSKFGISSFGASRRGIILADAASSVDELARLTSKGPVFLKNGDGSGPDINQSGEICFNRSPSGKAQQYFEVVVKESPSLPGRVFYKQKETITVNAWGPRGTIAVLSGGHYPGTKGPMPKLLLISRSGKVSQVETGLGNQLSNVIWTPNAKGIAVTRWDGGGKVIYSRSRSYILPAGWRPQAWNSSGTKLLVAKQPNAGGGQIGLWSPDRPRHIKVIGPIPKKLILGQFMWLDKPAKL